MSVELETGLEINTCKLNRKPFDEFVEYQSKANSETGGRPPFSIIRGLLFRCLSIEQEAASGRYLFDTLATTRSGFSTSVSETSKLE